MGKNEMRPEWMNLLPLRTGLSLAKPGRQTPEILGLWVRLVAKPPHLGMQRWQFTEDVEPCRIATFPLHFNVPGSVIGPIADLHELREWIP